ncbi:MAG: hypothetical protein QXU93_08090 [Thermoproteus sp.]
MEPNEKLKEETKTFPRREEEELEEILRRLENLEEIQVEIS